MCMTSARCSYNEIALSSNKIVFYFFLIVWRGVAVLFLHLTCQVRLCDQKEHCLCETSPILLHSDCRLFLCLFHSESTPDQFVSKEGKQLQKCTFPFDIIVVVSHPSRSNLIKFNAISRNCNTHFARHNTTQLLLAALAERKLQTVRANIFEFDFQRRKCACLVQGIHKRKLRM